MCIRDSQRGETGIPQQQTPAKSLARVSAARTASGPLPDFLRASSNFLFFAACRVNFRMFEKQIWNTCTTYVSEVFESLKVWNCELLKNWTFALFEFWVLFVCEFSRYYRVGVGNLYSASCQNSFCFICFIFRSVLVALWCPVHWHWICLPR